MTTNVARLKWWGGSGARGGRVEWWGGMRRGWRLEWGGRCAITVLRVHGPRRPLPAAHKTPAAMDAVVCPVVAGRAACGNATIRICAALVGVSDYKDDADQVQKSARQRHCLVMASPAPDPSTAKPSERMARRGAGSLSEQHHI